MKNAPRLAATIALVALASPTFAGVTTYASSGQFNAALLPGAYEETFTLTPFVPPSDYTNGTFAYTVSAPGGLFTLGTDVGTNQENEALTITFTSGNVHAVGGNFYATDINPDFQPVLMSITLSTGDTETWTPTSLSDSFRGFTSTALITSLVIGAPGQSLYATLDNLVVGTVPEPESWALAGLGLAALFIRRRRDA